MPPFGDWLGQAVPPQPEIELRWFPYPLVQNGLFSLTMLVVRWRLVPWSLVAVAARTHVHVRMMRVVQCAESQKVAAVRRRRGATDPAAVALRSPALPVAAALRGARWGALVACPRSCCGSVRPVVGGLRPNRWDPLW